MHKWFVLVVTIAMASVLAAPFASARQRPDGSPGGNVAAKYDLVKAKGARLDGGNDGPAKINGAGKSSTSPGGRMKH